MEKPASEKRLVLALGNVREAGPKARHTLATKRDGLGATAEGCQNFERRGRRTTPAPEKRCLFALGHVLEAETKARGTLPRSCLIE